MSKQKAFKLMSAALLSSLLCGAAYAGGFPSFMKSSAPSNGAADQMQGKLVGDFTTGLEGVLASQADMASALGHKDQAAKLTAASNALKTGATQPNFDHALSVSEQAATDASNDMKAANNISAQGKVEMAKAIPTYLIGVAGIAKLRPDCTSFLEDAQKEIASAGLMSAMSVKNKLAVGTYVATSVPGYMKSLASTAGSFISYAKSNNIPVPADATNFLGRLSL